MSIIELSEILANFGEFVGAIAVVATLIYLANQVRDSGRAAQFAAIQANRRQRVDYFLSMRDSSYMPAIMLKANSNESLSEEEHFRLISHNSASWGLVYAEWVQRELGSGGEFTTKETATLDRATQNQFSVEWWVANGADVFPEKFVAYVNTKLAATE
jgi:hypothetical protein